MATARAPGRLDFCPLPLDQDFTLFAVDLPFHGATEWCEGLDFTPLQLMDILEQILAEHGCQQRMVSLLGYSMGGRIALSIMNQFGLRLGCVVLLAPDGLRLNFWYWLTTQTWGRPPAVPAHHGPSRLVLCPAWFSQ